MVLPAFCWLNALDKTPDMFKMCIEGRTQILFTGYL